MTDLSRRTLLGAGLAAAALTPALSTMVYAADEGPFSLPELPYRPAALDPHIDPKTMRTHHGKHHAGYVRGLNKAVAKHGETAKLSLKEMLSKIGELPEDIRTAVRNAGGGHANHSMFWQVMAAEGDGGAPSGPLAKAIDRDFGSLDEMKKAFKRAGTKRFGSGWAMVTVDAEGKLGIVSTPNQDTPLMEGKNVLFGNDVWEHAYYLSYQNRRGDYLDAWWAVANWTEIGQRFKAAKKGTLDL